MDEFKGNLVAFDFWDRHECLRAEDVQAYTEQIQADERERILKEIYDGTLTHGRCQKCDGCGETAPWDEEQSFACPACNGEGVAWIIRESGEGEDE